ncbi:MAG: precorrin-4 C(11)-methyltransferase [Thermodesulfobacteriota bacterium]
MPKVSFIGAGPGDPELLTLKAARLIAAADLVLYTGSLVPAGAVARAKAGARVEDSSSMTLEQTHALLVECVQAGGDAARVHTGDPALYGAVAEQAALLDRDGIPWEVVPGVTAAFAAAAAAGVGFTAPGISQSLIVTRAPGRTPAPESESLRSLASHGCALAVYLSAAQARLVQDELLAGGLAPDTPVVVGHRVGWPDGSVRRASLAGLADAARGLDRQTVFLVLPALDKEAERSRLYAPEFGHGFRKAKE